MFERLAALDDLLVLFPRKVFFVLVRFGKVDVRFVPLHQALASVAVAPLFGVG